MPRKAIDTPAAYNQNDVICGRGGGSLRNLGNYLYRKLIQINKEAYNAAERSEKSKISKMIVSYIRNQDPPGRFLEKDGDTGEWNDMDDKRAIEKTSQAIRECIRKETAKAAKEGGNVGDNSSSAWLDNKANLQYAQQVEKMDLSSGIAPSANFQQHQPSHQPPLIVQQQVMSGNLQGVAVQDANNNGTNIGLDPAPVYHNLNFQPQHLISPHQVQLIQVHQQQQQQPQNHQPQPQLQQSSMANLHMPHNKGNMNGNHQVVTPIVVQTNFNPSLNLQAQQQNGSMHSIGSEQFVGHFNTLNMNENQVLSPGMSRNATFQHSSSMPIPANIGTVQEGLPVMSPPGGAAANQHSDASRSNAGGRGNQLRGNHPNTFEDFIKSMRPDGTLRDAPVSNSGGTINTRTAVNNGNFEIMEPDPIPFLPSHPSNASVTNAADAEAEFRLRSQSAPALSLEASTLRRSNKSLRTAGMSYHNGVAGAQSAGQANQQWPSDQKNATFSFNNNGNNSSGGGGNSSRNTSAANKLSNFPGFSFLETIEDGPGGGGGMPQKPQPQYENLFSLTGQQPPQQQLSGNFNPHLLMMNNAGGNVNNNGVNLGDLGDSFTLRRKKRTSPPRGSLQSGGSSASGGEGTLHQTTTT